MLKPNFKEADGLGIKEQMIEILLLELPFCCVHVKRPFLGNKQGKNILK